MVFSLIICTYKRPETLKRLLRSVLEQSYYPNEILIVDGSPDDHTRFSLESEEFPHLTYYKVSDEDRGLTRQRNYGIKRASSNSEIICFLDDDILLTPEYFKELLGTYKTHSEAVGVGGYILNDSIWESSKDVSFDEFEMDGYKRKLGSRNILRKKLGLLSNCPPGIMPEFSNGLSTGFLPPSGKIYQVEYFMGGVASYRREVFEKVQFSKFFEGYGLYEDMDFCLRLSRLGPLYVNSAAQVRHFHEESGRPSQYKYGKMVIRNGWYVWRVKYPVIRLRPRLKWYAIAYVLTMVRFGNVFTTSRKKEALSESLGRMVGLWSIIWRKPTV